MTRSVAASSNWADAAERMGRHGEWDFDLADSAPWLITALRCWRRSGLVLYVTRDGVTSHYGRLAHSIGGLHVEVRGQHYWAWVSGERVFVPADGNCFFHAVWRALQGCAHGAAVRRIFRGTMPASSQDAVDYFRREIRRYALAHPELEPVLLGNGDPNDAWEAWPSRLGGRLGRAYRTGEALVQALWADDVLEAMSPILLPDVFVDARADGRWMPQPVQDESSSAAGGTAEPSRFYAPARAGEHTPQADHLTGFSIGRWADNELQRFAQWGLASLSFGWLIVDEEPLDSILESDVFVDASADADWMPRAVQDESSSAAGGTAEPSRFCAGEHTPQADPLAGFSIGRWVDNELQRFAQWGLASLSFGWLSEDEEPLDLATPQPDTDEVPRTRKTEFQRVLFLVGSQISESITHQQLLGFSLGGLAIVSRGFSTGAANLLSLYGLVSASRHGDVWGQAVQILLALPWQQLPANSPLFSVAEGMKRYIDETLAGVIPECISDQLDTIYLGASMLAVVSYLGYFANREAVCAFANGRKDLPNGFIFKNNPERLRTPLGEAIVRIAGHMHRPMQAYSVLRAVADAKPATGLAVQVHPVCHKEDDPLAQPATVKAWQSREKKALRKAQHAAWAARDMAKAEAKAAAQSDQDMTEAPPPAAAATVDMPERNAAPPLTSAAPEVTPFLATAAATTVGIAAVSPSGLSGALAAVGSLITTKRLGFTAVAGVAGSVVVYTINKARTDWLADHPERHHTPAPPFLSEQALAQVAPEEKHPFRWIDHWWDGFYHLQIAIVDLFDNGLFEKTLLDIWSNSTATPSTGQTSLYAHAATLAFSDYQNDKTKGPISGLSSEIRYGAQLFNLFNSTSSENIASETDRILSFLIKIKTYETCRWRDLFGQPAEGSVASAVRLETVFSIPRVASAYDAQPVEAEAHKFLRSKLLGTTNQTVNKHCVNGYNIALTLYGGLLRGAAEKNQGVMRQEDVLVASRGATARIDSWITDNQEFLYNFRGASHRPALALKQAELLDYRYAAMYLRLLTVNSQNYLDILASFNNRMPASSDDDMSVLVLDSRALALKEALRKFSPQTDRAKYKDLGTKQLLDNYPAIVASSEEVLYFVSVAEAIFLNVRRGLPISMLYEEAVDPVQLINKFRQRMESLPTSRSIHVKGIAGAAYLQTIRKNTDIKDDAEYYEQFNYFRRHHLSNVSRLVALTKLVETGLHPYDIAVSRPRRCVELSLAIDELVNYDPETGGIDEYFNQWPIAGKIAFCQMGNNNWFVISTIGHKLFVRTISHKTMSSNPGLNKINLEIPFKNFNPRIRITNNEWRGDLLNALIFVPVFGDKFPLDKTTYRDAELRMLFSPDPKKTSAHDGRPLFEIVTDFSGALIAEAANLAEKSEYEKRWWEYITPLLPGFDTAYHRYHDPEYEPSFGEISWDVVNAALLVGTLGVPVADLFVESAAVARSSLLINAHRGFRGTALISRVVSETGSTIAQASFRATTATLSYFISPFEPIPLDLIGDALYKGFRRLMRGKFSFKSMPAKASVSEPAGGAAGGATGSADKKVSQVFKAGSSNDVRFFEFSYKQEAEVLLGSDNDPKLAPGGTGQYGGQPEGATAFAWNGNPDTLRSAGSITLQRESSGHPLSTPFKFSRSDMRFGPPISVTSTSPIVDTGFQLLQFGQAKNIVLSRFGEQIPFALEASHWVSNMEVLVIPSADEGAIGIRIDFADITADRSLLVSPGPMSDSGFMIAVSEQESALVFYHFSRPAFGAAARGPGNPVIRRLYDVHNAFFKNSNIGLNIADTVSVNDLHILARQFDYAEIAYADPTGTSRLSDVDQNSLVSRQTDARSASHHSVSAENLRMFNYALLDSDIQFSSSEGRIFYLVSRDSNGRIKIKGRTEIAGKLHDPVRPYAGIRPPANEDKTDEIQQIMRGDPKYVQIAQNPSALKPDDIRSLASVFEKQGYTARFRLVKTWPSEGTDHAQRHLVLLVDKNDHAYVVDIAATRFSGSGIESPIFESDWKWRRLYRTYLGDSVCTLQDFAEYPPFNRAFELGTARATAYDGVNEQSWEVLNRPSWMLSDSNQMLVDAIDVDQTLGVPSKSGDPSVALDKSFAGRWLDAVEDEAFNGIIRSSADAQSTLFASEKYLNDHDIATVTYVTLKYLKITDENPEIIFSLAALDKGKPTYMIDPSARRAGASTAIFPWNEWLDYRANGILISRKYAHAETAKKDLSAIDTNDNLIGAAAFFDESEWRYQILSFDPSYLGELSALVKSIGDELKDMNFDDAGRDLVLEQSKLQSLRQQVVMENGDPVLSLQAELRQQEHVVEQLSKYLSLSEISNRLTDLEGRVSGLQLPAITPNKPVYKSVYMSGATYDMSARLILSYPFIRNRLKIKTYDLSKKQYVPSERFEVAAVNSLDYLITTDKVASILEDYRKIYTEMSDLASAYARDGGGLRALEIAAMADVGAMTAEEIRGYCSSPSTYVFVVVDNTEKGHLGASVFGIATLRRSAGAHDQTVNVDRTIVHPFSQIRDDYGFIEYALRHRHSKAWSRAEWQKNKLENISGFLGYHSIRYVTSHMKDVKRIVANIVNPRSANIAATFGMKKVDSLHFYREMLGSQYLVNAQTYLRNLIRRRRPQTPAVSPVITPVVPPIVPPGVDGTELNNLLSGHIAGTSGKGAIYLKADRIQKNVPWPFVFVKSDPQTKHMVPQPSASLGTKAAGYIQLGRGSDIVSYSRWSRMSYGDFWKSENPVLKQLDVLQMTTGNPGAVGVKIAFSDLEINRPLLVSSGAMSECTQVVGIHTGDNAIYIYQAGKVVSGQKWKTSVNGVNDIANVHKALTADRSPFALSSPPTNEDLRGLYKFFDHTYIFSPTFKKGESLTPVDREDSRHWIYNYKSKDGKFSVGNSQLLILKNEKNEVSIEGFMETGLIGDTPSGRINVTPYNDRERYFPESAAPVPASVSDVISDLRQTLETDSTLKPFFTQERPDTALAATRVMASLTRAGRRWIGCRLVLIWNLPDSVEPQIRHLVIDNTNEIPFAFDITARQLTAFGLPFYGTEDAWARKIKDAYPRSFIAYQDFNSVSVIDSVFSGAISHRDAAVNAMTALNIPQWHVQKIDYAIYPYSLIDKVDILAKIHLPVEHQSPFVEIAIDPQWKAEVSLDGLESGEKDDVFKGVYSKPAGLRRKLYYIKTDERVYEVVLNQSKTGWNLKPRGPGAPADGPIAVWRKENGRWIIRKPTPPAAPAPLDEIAPDPKWKVDVSVLGLKYGTKEDIFKGVYEKPIGAWKKNYYIKSDGLIYEVTLNDDRNGWSLKTGDHQEPATDPIAIWRKDDGRWVVSRKSGLNRPTPRVDDGYPGADTFNMLLSQNVADLKVNRVLWHDDFAGRMVDRQAVQIEKLLDEEIKNFGGPEIYQQVTGRDPNAFQEPESWLLARNMFKLMAEDNTAVNPTTLEKTDFSKFSAVFADLDHQKNYVFLIEDRRLDHEYLIDVPAGPEMKSYVIQSSQGRGVIPELRFKDWMTNRGMDSVSAQDVLALMQRDFVNLPEKRQSTLLASIFALNKNPEEINIARLRSDKGATFIMQAYDRGQFWNNLQLLISKNRSA